MKDGVAVNINDRRRVSQLIHEEFQSRRAEITKEPTDTQVAAQVDHILAANNLKVVQRKLDAAKRQVDALTRQLYDGVKKLRNNARKKGRYNGCECASEYLDILREVALDHLKSRGQENDDKKLRAEERRLLAKIEIASTTADLEAVMKSAGLV